MVYSPNTLLAGYSAEKIRENNDFYPTPPFATHALLKSCSVPKRVWEPAAGRGWMSKEISRHGHDVVSTDLFKYEDPLVDIEYGIDFLKTRRSDVDAIITNPPYEKNLAEQFILHSIGMVDFTACLARLLFLESMRRYNNLFIPHPPTKILIFSGRFSCHEPKIEDPLGGTVAYAWYVWDNRVTNNHTELEWIDSKEMYKQWKAENSANLLEFIDNES